MIGAIMKDNYDHYNHHDYYHGERDLIQVSEEVLWDSLNSLNIDYISRAMNPREGISKSIYSDFETRARRFLGRIVDAEKDHYPDFKCDYFVVREILKKG